MKTRTHRVVQALSVCAGSALAATALAQPVNDSLSAPIVVSVPTTIAGTTVGATNDFGLTGACGNSALSKDVWYRWDCTESQMVEFNTCSGTTYNSVIQVFRMSNGVMSTEVTCNDNACNSQSRVGFNAQAGVSYMIRVTGGGTSSGPFILTTMVPPVRSIGPDVTVGDLSDIAQYGTGSVWAASSTTVGTIAGMRSYAVGTNSWNIGDRPAEWIASTNLHPVIGQQLYRYKDGKFEQIGASWLKHGFASTNSPDFPEMGACDGPPGGGSQLGVNCSDLYGSGLNGGRSYLGPRFDVNPINGVFTYSWTPLVGSYSNTDPIARRVVVADADVAPAQNAGADFYTDAQYITQDDAQWNNGRNNFSARKVNAATITTSPSFIGGTVRRTTALELWAMEKSGAGDAGINLSNLNFHERTVSVVDKWDPWEISDPDANTLPANQWVTFNSPIDARFVVASRVSQNGDSTFNYEYMILNVNSHRAGGAVAIRTPGAVSDVGFRAPMYHGGDRVLNNPWIVNNTAGRVSWTVDPATANVQVPGMSGTRQFGPNALMWGTMYNFRFRSTAAPVPGSARLTLFRAPVDSTGYQGGTLAMTGIKVPEVCLADVGSQGGVAGPDGTLDNNDFIVFIDSFFNGDTLFADVGKTGGVAGPDNQLDNNDFIVFIDGFFAGCI